MGILTVWSNQAGATNDTTTLDFTTLIPDGGEAVDGYVFSPANFDVEVVGNDADVTLKGKGPFPSSVAQDVTGGTFSSGGGKVNIQGFCIKSMEFTTTGSAYTINVVRAIV